MSKKNRFKICSNSTRTTLLARMEVSYYLITIILIIGISPETKAHRLSNKHSLYGSVSNNNNNMISSSELMKLFGRSSSTNKQQSKGGREGEFKLPETTNLMIKPALESSINERNKSPQSITKRQAPTTNESSKTKNDWWSQLETTEISTQNIQRQKTNTNSDRNNTETSNDRGEAITQSSGNDIGGSAKPIKPSQSNQKLGKAKAKINNLCQQWSSIKQKQRILTTVSMQELRNLDSKLVRSYKRFMRRRLYFFGGMLYRTRDFVVRLYKDAKTERKSLEESAKQVDNQMRETMDENYIKSLDDIGLKQQLVALGPEYEMISPDDTNNNKGFSKREVSDQQASSVSYSSIRTVIHQSEIRLESDSIEEFPKPNKPLYINDLRLRRQLDRAQALIDRIHRSTRELSLVIDDMMASFRIEGNIGESGKRNSTRSTKKNNKGKGRKSPLRVFIERFGNMQDGPKKPESGARVNQTTSVDIANTGNIGQILKLRPQQQQEQTVENQDDKNGGSSQQLTNDSVTRQKNDFSLASDSSTPLVLHPNLNIGPALDVSVDSLNSTSSLDYDIGFGESSTIFNIVGGANSSASNQSLSISDQRPLNTTVYHLDLTDFSSRR